MAHSTFRQPLPANLQPLMAEGYIARQGQAEGVRVRQCGAGRRALARAATTWAKFMIAHLQNGQYDGQTHPQAADRRLDALDARTRRSPRGDGMAHGFYETDINGMHVIAHGGDTEAFHSDLHLFLDEGVGIFVSFNSPGKEGAAGPLRDAIFSSFADRYFPEPANLATKVGSETAQRKTRKSSPESVRQRAARGSQLPRRSRPDRPNQGRGRQGRRSAAPGRARDLAGSRVNGCMSAR